MIEYEDEFGRTVRTLRSDAPRHVLDEMDKEIDNAECVHLSYTDN